MAQTAPALHSPSHTDKRPRGILKNSHSFQHSSPDAHVSPTSEHPAFANNNDAPAPSTSSSENRPPIARELSEKEIVQMNTERNAGPRRQSSSNLSRRQSSQSNVATGEPDEHGSRLKWDEANLYLNEGQMGGKMKIDEPKTPYAKHYDPAEDEAEINSINANDIAVDELDMEKSKTKKSKDVDIPGLDLGEPEMEPVARRESSGERKVVVEPDPMDVDGGHHHHHGEDDEDSMTGEEREKHKKFEELRKKHYEMKNIKSLLGHSEEMDDDDDVKQ